MNLALPITVNVGAFVHWKKTVAGLTKQTWTVADPDKNMVWICINKDIKLDTAKAHIIKLLKKKFFFVWTRSFHFIGT